MTPKNIEIKKAWIVTEYSGKIIEGEGFLITFTECFSTKKSGFFRISEKEDWQLVKEREMAFSTKDAAALCKEDAKKLLDYYERQAKSATDKISELKNKTL